MMHLGIAPTDAACAVVIVFFNHAVCTLALILSPAQVSYALSPVQIIVAEKGRAWYHFLTTTCAVVGGVFTVAGICDGLLHTSVRYFPLL